MEAFEIIEIINNVAMLVTTALYAYQFFYIVVPLLFKNKKHKTPKHNRIGILISARNEEAVLPLLIDSIHDQTYPHELIDTFVVADNCTDGTAAVARAKGAYVWERHNLEKIGKGYALDWLISRIKEDHDWSSYDGFIVLDADNLLDIHFVAEMNKTFSDGYKILTSYRNSKNYGDNWISAGYSLWFMREARFLNLSRQICNASCAVSGTGFMFAREIVDRVGGWPYHLLTEDLEFTCANIIAGEKIGIAIDAELFDEQPTTIKQSTRQRLRWAKGFLQLFRDYGRRLFGGVVRGRFPCYDLFMVIFPAIFITAPMILMNLCSILIFLWDGYRLWGTLTYAFLFLFNAYIGMFSLGAITTIHEWDRIHTSTFKKILYTFTFPFYMATYIPIGVAAVFMKVEWKPIKHNAKSMDEIVKTK